MASRVASGESNALSEAKGHRLDDKDALDVLRLLQAVPTATLAQAFLIDRPAA